MGSSGTAVVAGVALANELGKLRLSKDRMLDYCLMIERHPDNVAASLYGGFVGTYLVGSVIILIHDILSDGTVFLTLIICI